MLADLWYRLRAILRPRSVERDLDDELRFHLERQTQKYARRGFPQAEAARLASLEIGGLEQVKEQCRDARGVGLWEQTVRNLRLAFRSLRKRPGFAVVVILTLALGIGANTAILSVVDGVLLRPAPVADIERLAMVWETDRNTGTTHEPASVPDFLDLREGANEAARKALMEPRLERFIGVIYRPDTERLSHYSGAVLPKQLDAWVWFDETTAVTPLPAKQVEGAEETYPFGL